VKGSCGHQKPPTKQRAAKKGKPRLPTTVEAPTDMMAGNEDPTPTSKEEDDADEQHETEEMSTADPPSNMMTENKN